MIYVSAAMSAPAPAVLRRIHPAFRAWLADHKLDDNLGFASYYSPEELDSGEAAMDMLGELGLEEDHLESLHKDVLLLADSVRGRLRQVHLGFERKEPHDFFYARKRALLDDALQEQLRKVGRAEAQEQKAQAPPPPLRPLFGNRLRRLYALEGDSAARQKAEEAQRKLWMQRLVDGLRSVDAPSIKLAGRSKHADELLELQVGPRRAGTLRLRVRAWAKYRHWLQMSHGLNHPEQPHQFLDYLLDRRSEPCSRGVLSSIVDTMRFVEKAMGLGPEARVTDQDYVRQAVAGILRSTEAKTVDSLRGPARAPVAWCLIELERAVMDEGRAVFDRMLSWWMLTSSWAVLRFDDHRGIGSDGIMVDELGINLHMTRTKTTGRDKAVQSKPGFVAWEAWLAEPQWHRTGLELWSQNAPWQRDYFLVVPAAGGGCRPREMRYTEYAGRMRNVIANLDIPGYGAAGGAVAAFWQPHSWRAFLPSVLAAVGAPPSLLSWLSAWRPQSGAAYVRTQREKTRIMQATVARILRAHLEGDDPIGEASSLAELERHLGDRGVSVEDTAVICAGIRKFMGQPVDEILWPQVREDSASAAHADLSADAANAKGQPVPSDDEDETYADGEYIISISDGRRVRRLHRVGLCHRRPGLHYRRYERCGPMLPPPSQYNDHCRDCWKKEGPEARKGPEDDSDTCGGTTSSSTSTSSERAGSSRG